MRLATLLGGLVLAVVGFFVLFSSWAANAGTTTTQLPAGSAVKLTPRGLTAETVSVGWYASANATRIYLTSLAPSCPDPSGLVGSGRGEFGTFNASVDPGKTYYLYQCNETAGHAVTVFYSVSGGLTLADILGGLAMALGFLVLLLGVRRTAPVAEPPERGKPDGAEEEEVELLEERPRRKPGEVAALLGLSIRRSRGVPIQRARPSAELRGHQMQACKGCGRVYPPGRYTTCPACGNPF